MARFAEVPVFDFVNTCVNVSGVHAYCRDCPDYNKRWSCPPYDFSVEAYWKRFSRILLYEEKVLITPNRQVEVYSQEEINAISRSILAPTKRRVTDYLLVLEGQNPGSRALFAGNCELCGSCTKEKSIPCIHPDKMRYSIEALGGNVSLAAQIYFDDTVLWAKEGHLPKYLLLIGGLLKV